MKLTKREFLKAIGYTSLVAVLPLNQIEGLYDYYRKFNYDPTHEYGRVLPYTNDEGKKLAELLLKKQANLILPPNIYYEIRSKVPSNFGRDKGIAWYHNGFMKKEIEILRKPVFREWGGYYYHGTFKTTVNHG